VAHTTAASTPASRFTALTKQIHQTTSLPTSTRDNLECISAVSNPCFYPTNFQPLSQSQTITIRAGHVNYTVALHLFAHYLLTLADSLCSCSKRARQFHNTSHHTPDTVRALYL
jgi:hypothetical protein